MEVWKIIFLYKWVMAVGSMLIFQGVVRVKGAPQEFNLDTKNGYNLIPFVSEVIIHPLPIIWGSVSQDP